VEPFAGGAAVFFTKKPSESEVLNDINDNYVFTYRTIKSLTDAEIAEVKRFNWKSDRETWWKCKGNLKNKTYSSKLHRLWNFIYWSKFAYNGGVGMGAWSKFKEGKVLNIPFEQIRERLKNTTITQVDYKDTIRTNDAEGTFFYIDPPYYPANDPRFKSAKIGGIDMDEFAKICSSMKGKCIISLGRDTDILDKFDKTQFQRKMIATKYGYGWQTQKTVEWPILLNFDATKEKIGDYAFEDEFVLKDIPDGFKFEDIGHLDLEE
jgi:DNA adenine methylase